MPGSTRRCSPCSPSHPTEAMASGLPCSASFAPATSGNQRVRQRVVSDLRGHSLPDCFAARPGGRQGQCQTMAETGNETASVHELHRCCSLGSSRAGEAVFAGHKGTEVERLLPSTGSSTTCPPIVAPLHMSNWVYPQALWTSSLPVMMKGCYTLHRRTTKPLTAGGEPDAKGRSEL